MNCEKSAMNEVADRGPEELCQLTPDSVLAGSGEIDSSTPKGIENTKIPDQDNTGINYCMLI